MSNGQVVLHAERVREMIHVRLTDGTIGLRSARTAAEARAFARVLMRLADEVEAELRDTPDDFS